MHATYDNAQTWADGPERVYRRLAAAAVDLLAGGLSGALVVDVGAGTGAASHELRARGARTMAVDVSAAMVTLAPGYRVVGDVNRLPFRNGSADKAIACLVLSHVDRPAQALAEMARVSRGLVVATAFPAGATHPVKTAADEILAAAGYRAPTWYTQMKQIGEERVGTAARLLAHAHEVGLTAEVTQCEVGLAGLDSAALAAWRLGMAPVADWMSTLDERDQAAIRKAVQRAADRVAASSLPLLILLGTRQ